MCNRCYLCNKLFNKNMYILDSNLYFYDDYWNERFDNKNYCFSFNNHKMCIKCGFIFSFNYDINKFYKINKRTFLNKKIKIKFPLDKKNRKNKYDKCVICNNNTEYLIKDNINNRCNYIIGLGQTCNSCFNELN